MHIIGQVLEIAGALGLFLFGMKIMSEGIQKAAGSRFKSILKFMTGNRFAAVFTGLAITAIIQSSSATTVMVVSFVNAGLMNLFQSIGVILGANIGTTITAWIVSLLGFKLKVSALAIPTIGIGFPFLFIKKLKHRDFGNALIGFGLLFLGLDFLKHSVPDIGENPDALYFVTHMTGGGVGSILLFILLGTLLTIIVQSSSASMAITLTMAYQGWIDYPTAAAVVLGQNIGTTVTAYFASIGANTNAKRASRAHIMFNILGTIWVIILFNPFSRLVDFLVPGDVYGAEAKLLLPVHLSMFHTIFNVINTVIFLPFIKQFEKLVKMMVKEKAEPSEAADGAYTFKYISSALQDTPELYLITVQDEIFKMASLISEMFSRFMEVFKHPDQDLSSEVKALKKLEDRTDEMQQELSTFMVDLVKDSMNSVSAGNVNAQIRIVNELESMGDSCYNLILLTVRKYEKNYQCSQEATIELVAYMELVFSYIGFIKDHLNRNISDKDLREAEKFEKKINKTRTKLKNASQERIGAGADVASELLMLDLIKNLEHIGDYGINVAEALVNLS